MREEPSWTWTSANRQPAGRFCTHGTSAADGTDWAISHSGSRLLQSTALMYREVLTRSDRASQATVAVRRRGNPPRG
jgi:hypothetical protein